MNNLEEFKSVSCINSIASTCVFSILSLIQIISFIFNLSKTDTKLTTKTFNISSLDVFLDHCASSQDFDLTFICLEVLRGKYNYNVLKWKGSRVALVVSKINVLLCRDL